jgi:hypothetical protein
VRYFCKVGNDELDVPGQAWVEEDLKDQILLDEIEVFLLLPRQCHLGGRR